MERRSNAKLPYNPATGARAGVARTPRAAAEMPQVDAALVASSRDPAKRESSQCDASASYSRYNDKRASRCYSCPPMYRPERPSIRPRVPIKEKLSIGIACCRFYGNRPQILMIKKRYTYAFSAFVHGVYEGNNDKSVLALLNAMTPDEKIVLQSLNYATIWGHIWLSPPAQDSQKYRHLKNKFDAAFISSNNGVRLMDLIARSGNGSRVWEIPKGRQRKQEPELHCGIREFYEETGIEKSGYYIYPNATRTHAFIDEGVQYTQKYFIAYSNKPIQPRINLSSRVQIEEVSDIRWMTIEDVRFVDPTGRLSRLVTPIFNYVKKHTTRIA